MPGQADQDGIMQLLVGVGAGGIAYLAVGVVKGLVDLAAWLTGADNRPVRLGKGLADLGLGAAVAYETFTKPTDDFWKGAGGAFSALEILSGLITTACAIHDYVTGSSGELSPDFQIDKALAEYLTGRKWER